MLENKLNFATMTLGELASLTATSKSKRRQIIQARRQANKHLKRLVMDMNNVYKDSFAYDILIQLADEDVAWPGDFDIVRSALADLMEKCAIADVFPNEIHELAVGLRWMKVQGEK